MASFYELIDSYEDVQLNVHQFNYDLEFDTALCLRLNQFRSWYYIPELDEFGPSQFIGYKMMRADDYQIEHFSGEPTERALRRFFHPLQRSNPLHRELEVKLAYICGRYGKRPNRAHRINIPRAWN